MYRVMRGYIFISLFLRPCARSESEFPLDLRVGIAVPESEGGCQRALDDC